MRNQNSDIPGGDYMIKVIALLDMNYEIDIYRKLDNAKIQTIALRNAQDPSKDNNAAILNKSGVPHLYILGDKTEKGSWYKVWRWNSSTKQFAWYKATEPGEVK